MASSLAARLFAIIARSLAALFAIYFLFIVAGVVFYSELVNPGWTPLMLERWLVRGYQPRQTWVPIEEMDKDLVIAAVASEDQRFFDHSGLDLVELDKSIVEHFRDGKRLRGASTISQQTVKNLFFLPGRSWFRKIVEVPVTWTVESVWSKRRILEVYLNIVEMGPGLYGVEAASRNYYGKSSGKLSRREAASLIGLLPNPLVRNPLKPNGALRRKIDFILTWSGQVGVPEDF